MKYYDINCRSQKIEGFIMDDHFSLLEKLNKLLENKELVKDTVTLLTLSEQAVGSAAKKLSKKEKVAAEDTAFLLSIAKKFLNGEKISLTTKAKLAISGKGMAANAEIFWQSATAQEALADLFQNPQFTEALARTV